VSERPDGVTDHLCPRQACYRPPDPTDWLDRVATEYVLDR
jgi:hypothetical protein